MKMTFDHPIEGAVPNIGFPVKLGGTPQQIRRRPPLLGEHNDEIFAELGIAEIERWLATGGTR
jgi:formyl-CoA transferase